MEMVGHDDPSVKIEAVFRAIFFEGGNEKSGVRFDLEDTALRRATSY